MLFYIFVPKVLNFIISGLYLYNIRSYATLNEIIK